MIRNEEQLAQSVEQLARMYRAVLTLRSEILPRSFAEYALMAEGPLEEIRRLQDDIQRYIEPVGTIAA
jgi:hypothetical protein